MYKLKKRDEEKGGSCMGGGTKAKQTTARETIVGLRVEAR